MVTFYHIKKSNTYEFIKYELIFLFLKILAFLLIREEEK